jgi:hypothetical protein
MDDVSQRDSDKIRDDVPACCECVCMHALASLIRKAFQNNGVQADSLSPCLQKRKENPSSAVSTSRHVLVSDLLGRCPDDVPLGSWSWNGGLGERKNEDVGRLDALFLDT